MVEDKSEFIKKLRQIPHTLIQELRPEMGRLLNDPSTYVRYLFRTYTYVKWTSMWLDTAGKRLCKEGKCPAIANLMLRKALEEANHDQWVLEDLNYYGVTEAKVADAPVCLPVQAYIAWNQFLVNQGNPLGFVGTAYCLESLAAGSAGTLQRLAQHSPIPPDAMKFLRRHVVADVEHVAELERLIATIESDEDRASIILTAEVVRALYIGLVSSAAGSSAR